VKVLQERRLGSSFELFAFMMFEHTSHLSANGPSRFKPAPGQMHAQFLHQLALAGDAIQIGNQQDAQQELGSI
jgi:hypothetical protein